MPIPITATTFKNFATFFLLKELDFCDSLTAEVVG
jgi:hypothetical protein